MLVLGIETSCDETATALYDSERGLLAHEVYSQIELHAKYGGVVPELASRDHIRKLTPLIRQVCEKAKLALTDVDGIAYLDEPLGNHTIDRRTDLGIAELQLGGIV